jgi:hypothetical protein
VRKRERERERERERFDGKIWQRFCREKGYLARKTKRGKKRERGRGRGPVYGEDKWLF